MAGKTYEIGFKIAADLEKSFGASFTAADKALLKFNSALKKTQSIAAGFKGKMQSSLGKVKSIMDFAQPSVDFEQSMAKVGVISGATDEDLAKLTKTARQLGRDLPFTAQEASEAMNYLAMAGWDTNQIIAGMPGLLALAGASGTDLAKTADIVSDNLTAFGLSAADAGHLADVYAMTVTSTNTTVEMLGETMKYAAPIANAFGVSMEETSAMAGILANSGIKASQAGTVLRAGFIRLAGPTAQSEKAMKKLGISLSDASKQQYEASAALKKLGISMSDTSGPKKMSKILTELREKTKGLSDDALLSNLKQVFGSEAASGWVTLIKSADGAFDSLMQQFDSCEGKAVEMFGKMNSTTEGSMKSLQSALSDIQLEIGNTILPTIGESANQLKKYAGVFSDWLAEHPVFTKTMTKSLLVFAGLGTAINGVAWIFSGSVSKILKFGAGLGKVVKTAGTAYKAYKDLGGIMGLAAKAQAIFNAVMSANPVVLVIIAIAGLIAAGWYLYKNWDEVCTFLSDAWGWVSNEFEAFGALISEKWDAFCQPIIAFGSYIKEEFAEAWVLATQKMQEFGAWISEKWSGIVQPIKDFVQWLIDKWNELFGLIGKGIEAISTITPFNTEGAKLQKSTGNALASSFQNKTLGEMSYQDATMSQVYVPGMAAGGIVTQPTVSLIGEAGPEAVIPLDKASGVGTVSYSPNITINGNANKSDIDSALKDNFEQFKAFMNRYQREQARVSYV